MNDEVDAAQDVAVAPGFFDLVCREQHGAALTRGSVATGKAHEVDCGRAEFVWNWGRPNRLPMDGTS